MAEQQRITAALVEFHLHIDDHTEVRLLRSEDATALYEATVRNRQFLAPWLSWIDRVTDVSDTYAFVRDAEREARAHTAFKAGIWRRGHLIGCVDLHAIDWENASAQIGYWLDEAHTGAGIMSAAVRLLCEYAFEALDLHRLEIRAAVQNAPSRRIPQRLGFAFEGTLRDALKQRGAFVDTALYSLVSDETQD